MEGRRELWRSLRTSDFEEAKLRSLREGQEVERHFQALRKQAERAQADPHTFARQYESRALSEDEQWRRSGMTLRHLGYGIGALTYFRRLIEETTDEMLSLLEKALMAADDKAALEQLRSIRTGKRFEDKVKLAADVLPAHLRPGGVNPFNDLYQLLSDGLHAQSDEECCERVDRMDLTLKHIYTRLRTHADEEKKYADVAKELRKKAEGLQARQRKH